jgi:hypothetical protein
MMDFKRKEITEYFDDFIKENDSAIKENDRSFIDDLHHYAFNENYFIIGTYKATQYMEDQIFNIINFIKEYENDNFGEVNTDFSDPEKVLNMYVYIIGEEIVNEYKEKNNLW